jgi:hypothetical protein
MRVTVTFLTLGLLALGIASVRAEDAPSARVRDLKLFSKDQKWTFANGPEFPGAKGSYELGAGDPASGILSYDFSGGGNYVNAGTDVAIDKAGSLHLKVKSADQKTILVRLADKSGQWHQYKASYSNAKEWQPISLNLADPSPEHWDGANDGVVKFPISLIYLGVLNEDDVKSGKVEYSGVATGE